MRPGKVKAVCIKRMVAKVNPASDPLVRVVARDLLDLMQGM